MRLKTCATVLMACGLVSSTVAAQTYVSRGYPGETLEAKRALVESSEPTWYVVGSSPVTLGEIIDEECGPQPADFRDYLVRRAEELNAEPTPGAPIAPKTVVAVPFCHRVEFRHIVTVDTGDSLYRIARTNMGVAGDTTLGGIVALNGGPTGPTLPP